MPAQRCASCAQLARNGEAQVRDGNNANNGDQADEQSIFDQRAAPSSFLMIALINLNALDIC